MKSQRKSRNIKNNLSDRQCPKHYHMSHNYYRIVGNLSILSVEVIDFESQKNMNIFMGSRGNKSTSETKYDTKSKHEIVYTVQ